MVCVTYSCLALPHVLLPTLHVIACNQVQYKIKWAGYPKSQCTWEPIENIIIGSDHTLYDEWKKRAIPSAVYRASEADLRYEPDLPDDTAADGLYSGPKPPAADVMEEDAAGNDAGPSTGIKQACALREGGRFARRTGGAIFGFCACGLMLPPIELTDAESTKAMLCYIMRIFRGRETFDFGKGPLHLGFDDMCHLARYAEAHKEEHERLGMFVRDVVKVVDKFHFRNHVGRYCRRFCNPHKWPLLKDANMSVAEQSFKYVARYKVSMRYMNNVRFNFMLQKICMLDHFARHLGLVRGAVE